MQPIFNSKIVLPVEPRLANVSGPGNRGFSAELGMAVDKIDAQRQIADQEVKRFLNGEGEDLHKIALATQEAELSLELFQQVRNKVVQAYQEVMRMQM